MVVLVVAVWFVRLKADTDEADRACARRPTTQCQAPDNRPFDRDQGNPYQP